MNCLHPHDGPIFEELAGLEVTFDGERKGDYIPLRAITDHTTVLTRWTPTPEQRSDIAAGKDIYLELKTFGSPLPPIRLTVGMTVEEGKRILGLTSE